MRRTNIVALLVLGGLACSATPTVIPTKNLDRPVDMAFVCLGMVPSPVDGSSVLSGQPMSVCHPNDALDPTVNLHGPRNLGTFAFVANSSRGEMAIADMDRGRLLDLSPASPGYGMLPIGNNPEAVASTQDGCWVATVNRTSCDLSLVDPSRLLASTFSDNAAPATPASSTGDAAHRLVVRTQSGRALATSTGEIAFLPSASASATCHSDEGADSAARPKAVMTFPSCDLVAVVELSFAEATARIVSSYYVRPNLPGGFQDAGTEPVCPVDCPSSGESGDGGLTGTAPDGGADPGAGVDGGSVVHGAGGSYYLQPLALVPDGSRVYVGSLLDEAVTALDVGSDRLSHPVRFALAENPLGVNRLRLAVDPYREVDVTRADGTIGKVQGSPLQGRGAFFLYAFTRDDSVRVIDISGASPVECDVNAWMTPAQKTQGCIPVGSAPRKPLAVGPGIRIPTFIGPDSPPPVPRDIAFADLKPSDGDTNYHALSGQFGFLLASNGQVYTLNLAPTGEDGQTSIPNSSCVTDSTKTLPATATNSFRALRDVGQCVRTPLTVSIAPQRIAPPLDQAFATTTNLSAAQGPLIQSFSADNGETTKWIDFPDPDSIVSPRWDVTWEGALPGASRMTGVVQSAGGNNAGVISDSGADFCSSGVQPGDVLMFAGCNQNSDCQPDDQYSCQVPVSGGRGMCLPIQPGTGPSVPQDECAPLFGSRLRYEVVKVTQKQLTLGLKLDEVPKTTLNPCKMDSDCWPDPEHRAYEAASPDGGVSKAFACIEVHPNDPRCVERCQDDSDCRAGHVCASVPGLDYPGKLCVEAPPISQACFPQPMTAYTVRAGHAFVVSGSALPRLRTTKTAADGSCVLDTTADPTLINRIPLDAPKCPDSFLAQAQAPVFVQNLSAQRGSNPCLFFATGTGGASTNGGGAATNGSTAAPVSAFFENPQVRFVMTNLDQYAGDLYGIHFELQYGFVPLTAQIPLYEVLLTMGTRIITGPTKTPESPLRLNPPTGTTSFPYLYVIDQGTTALTPGSRGQVIRLNPRAGETELESFDTAVSGPTPFQLQ